MSFGQECEALTRDRVLAAIEQAAFLDCSILAVSGNRNGI